MSTLHFLPRGHDDPLTTLSLARVLLDSVRAGRRPGALRIYRPESTVVFGGRDRFLAGFDDAVGKAREAGFTPLLRTLGGRVAAYHHGSLVIDHVEPADQMFTGTQARFTSFGDMYVRALQSVGIDARLGEIPGEYCPGEHSVNVAGKIKAIGTAQRVTKTGWLFSSSVIITDPAPIRSVLTDVEAALGVDWDPATGGSISEVHPDVTVDAVEQAFLAEYARGYDLEPSEFSAEEIEAAGAYNSVSQLESTR
ncbi:lipoate--protein ligase family protein [Brevibacterium sp. HMSC24B04]|uniref:lipoate--protein ligase family protein n=1 Tax=Brevibacterium sp. HMSC24B04 TaxID=1581060 RepID=UPI0008A3D7BA|nr:lipoate--protein ligase family protein [Brevibacterium sp. HMSC24B04]OFT92139.1 lipoate--protein ligase [Brevibacterium sp. HMSC24B04]